MRILLKATPAELYEKSDELIKALATQIEPINPDLAEELRKATKAKIEAKIPRKEPVLKYPVLRTIMGETQKAYDKTLEKLIQDITRVLNEETSTTKAIKSFIPETGSITIPEVSGKPADTSMWPKRLATDADLWKGGLKKQEEEPEEDENSDPDYDEEGELIINPETGMSPSEEQEAKERGELEEEEEEESEKSLEKAGPFIGPRGGKWKDPQHTIPWKPEQAPVQKPQQQPEKRDYARLSKQLVDVGKCDDAWARMTQAIEEVHDELMKISDTIGWSGRIPRKKLAKEIERVEAAFLTKVRPARVTKVGGLQIESLDSSIEQHAAEVVHAALSWRRSSLLAKDPRTGRPEVPASEIREGFFSGMNKIRENWGYIYRQGRGIKVMEAQTKPTEENLRRKQEWEDTWRKEVTKQLRDVDALPGNHHQLLDQAQVRVRFMTHTALTEVARCFTAGEATYDERTKSDLIMMHTFSHGMHKEYETGVVLSHEVAHIIDRLVGRTMESLEEKISRYASGETSPYELPDQFLQQLGDKAREVSGRDIEDSQYMDQRTLSWVRDKGEWFAEAYRYAYRDGEEMSTTLQSFDFDLEKFRTLVDRLVVQAVEKKVAPVQDFIPESVAFFKSENPEIRAAIEAFLQEHPSPEDKEMHALAERLGIEHEELEENVYAMLAEAMGDSLEKAGTSKVVRTPYHAVDFYDFTKPIADADARGYERVKGILKKRGAKEADFEEGGKYYGQSTNQLIEKLRSTELSG